jgi:PAS domain S-box-containing protein
VAAGVALPYARKAVIARASSQLNTVADLKSIQIRKWLSAGGNAVKLVAKLREVEEILPELLSPANPETFARLRQNLGSEIKAVSEIFPYVRSVSLLHPETGRVLISTDRSLEGRDRSPEDYFQGGLKRLFVSSVHFSLGREEPVLIVAAPFIQGDGEPLVVIAAELNLTNLAETLSSRAGLGRGGRVYLVDSRGFYLTLPPSVEGVALGVVARSEGVRRALAGENGLDTYTDPAGVPVVGVYRWLAGENLALLVEVDEAEIAGHIRTAWMLIGFTVLALLVVTTLAAHWLAGRLGRPLAAITDAAHALRGGDLSRRVPADVRDEIGQFATAFNEMAAELQRSYENLETLVEQRTAGLEQAEARLQGVVETASDAIVSIDESMSVIMFNRAAEDMLDCPAEQAIGRPVTAFIRERDSRPRKPAGSPREIIVKRRGGETFPAEISVSKTTVDGQLIRTVILRDISERKRAEHELAQLNEELEKRVDERTEELRAAQAELLKTERLATLGQLTATVSHEIRNPLGVMRTSLYLIEQKQPEPDDAVLRAIERMKRSIARCDRIIDELLDFSRVRGLEVETTEIDRWLAHLLDEQQLAGGVGIEFEPGCPDTGIDFDRERLRRAVINVVENAAQAIAEDDRADRTAPVRVATRLVAGYVELSIADDGPGIPDDVRARIFEPLFSTRSFGVGLGLAVVKQVVEQHGGEIVVECGPDRGTRFIFRLPAGNGPARGIAGSANTKAY